MIEVAVSTYSDIEAIQRINL